VLELHNGKIEALTMHKFEYALSTMVSKESAYNIQMRYLTREEREAAKGILEDNTSENKKELAEKTNQQRQVETLLRNQLQGV
jgi:hypothetical protein